MVLHIHDVNELNHPQSVTSVCSMTDHDSACMYRELRAAEKEQMASDERICN